jgi:hypothetical protein
MKKGKGEKKARKPCCYQKYLGGSLWTLTFLTRFFISFSAAYTRSPIGDDYSVSNVQTSIGEEYAKNTRVRVGGSVKQ